MSRTISAGGHHTLVVDREGRVWSFGRNNYGQLGLGSPSPNLLDISRDVQLGLGLPSPNSPNTAGVVRGGLANTEYRDKPTRIDGLSDIISVSTGESHSLALDKNGQVWSFGRNNYGQLGLGDNEDRYVPTRIEKLPFIVSISAGVRHNLLLDQDGGVWSFGANSYGQLGLGNNLHQNKPARIEELSSIISISAGGVHSLALDRDGQVWSFGHAKYGRLGLGHNFDRDRPTPIEGLPFITSISAGGSHSLALDQEGQLLSWGLNNYGQLGLGLPNPNLLVSSRAGQLGLGRPSPNSPNTAGGVRGGLDMYPDRNKPTPVIGLPPISSISAGGNHSLILENEGYVRSFGSDESGQLGLGEGNIVNSIPTRVMGLPSIVSISAGASHSLVVNRNGKVWSFGDNGFYQLGLGEDDDDEYRDHPVEIPGLITQTPPDNSPNFILTVFSLMEPYLDQLTDARINSYDMEDTIMELDLGGITYLARLQYDPSKDSFEEPIVSEEEYYIELFNELLQKKELKSSAFRPDFYQDEAGNEALEFEDLKGQRYLIRVHPN